MKQAGLFVTSFFCSSLAISSLITRGETTENPQMIREYVSIETGSFGRVQILQLDEKTSHKIDSELAETFLGTIIDRLSMCVFETNFDVSNFEPMAQELSTQLLEASKTIHEIQPVNEELLLQLKFAHTMFYEMAEASELLRLYDATGNTDQQLVNCVIGLNVRLFNVFHKSGLPDWRDSTFGRKVIRFSDELAVWMREFQKLTSVPFGIGWMFEKQASRANNTLEFLKTQIPTES